MTTVTRRGVLNGVAGLAAASSVPGAQAQSAYPAGLGTLKVIVPFAPGGASDIIGRLLADSLARRWNVSAVLEHVPGGSATIGIGRVANGSSDGSQILLLSLPYVTTQFLMPRLAYQPERDIQPLVQLTRQPNLLCVKKNLPVNSVAEFIAYAKARPGELSYASSGNGSPLHLSAELFQRMTGTRMTNVAYSGSAPAQNDLAGGHVDVLFDNAASIVSLARSGTVKALAITTPGRYALAPEFPAVAETVPGYASGGWFGIAVKSDTPPQIQAELENAGLDLLKEKTTVERLASALSEPVGSRRDVYAKFLSEERQRWGSLIADLNRKQ